MNRQGARKDYGIGILYIYIMPSSVKTPTRHITNSMFFEKKNVTMQDTDQECSWREKVFLLGFRGMKVRGKDDGWRLQGVERRWWMAEQGWAGQKARV